MGLIEQIISGSRFSRKTVTINSTSPGTTGQLDMDATYILLGASVSAPCRVRLYGTSGSVAIDKTRPSSSFDYSASVALNLDAGFTDVLSINFIPPIISTTYLNNKTWYNVESSTSVAVTLKYYPIEIDTGSRTYLQIPSITGTSLAGNETASGDFTSPKSFLILGALSENSESRLRLYSRPIDQVPNSEKNRTFVTEPTSGSYLISDIVYDSASFFYRITPTIQAYNLETYESGNNRVGYILENLSSNPQTGVYGSVLIYPLED